MASDFDIILQAPATPTSDFDMLLFYTAPTTGDIFILWIGEEAPG
jgi:hypothetical protein